MKCVRNIVTNEVKRLGNAHAEKLVEDPNNNWVYTNKANWKASPNTTWVKNVIPPNPMNERKAYRRNRRDHMESRG